MIGLYVLGSLIVIVELLIAFNIGKEYDKELEELYREQKARVEEKRDRQNI